jgi:hypothetical protein
VSILDHFRNKDPEPVVGDLVKGEVIFRGKKSYPYYGWVERTGYTVDVDGEPHTVGIFVLRAKRAKNIRTFKTWDQDITTDPGTIPFGETAQGMKSRTRLMGGIMIILDVLVMYFLYLIASSGFVLQYNPQAMSLFIVLIGFIVIAFAVLMIYLWYASKISVFSAEVESIENGPIAAALEGGREGIPVYLRNSRRETLPEFFSKVTRENVKGALQKAKEVLAVANDSALWKAGEDIEERNLKIRQGERLIAARNIEGNDRALAERPYFITSRSWAPVVISALIVAAGFIVLYFVYG